MKIWTGGRLVVERLVDDDPNLEFYHACSHFLGVAIVSRFALRLPVLVSHGA